MNTHYRQGDVLIVADADIPENLQPVARDHGRVVLAYGEVTGHAHAITDDACALYTHEELEDRFLQVLGDGGVDLTHEEHGTINIPQGNYIVRGQREYAPGELPQRVAD